MVARIVSSEITPPTIAAASIVRPTCRHMRGFNDTQRDAIKRLRVIDGTVALRLGIDALVFVHAVLLGGKSVASASRRQPGGLSPKIWSAILRLSLDEIAALAGLATKPTRPALPERYALQAAVLATTVRGRAHPRMAIPSLRALVVSPKSGYDSAGRNLAI